MQKIEIKIKGSGTLNQVKMRLLDVVRAIEDLERTPQEIERITIEDSILYTEIEEGY